MVTKRPHPTHCARPDRKPPAALGAAVAAALAGLWWVRRGTRRWWARRGTRRWWVRRGTRRWSVRPALRRLEVAGASMLPAFGPGERLLAVGPWPLRPGHVVAVRDPRRPQRLLVKRVAAIGAAGIVVHGDNAPASTDSREFGPLRRRAVVGRVVYRYSPADRAGWWPG